MSIDISITYRSRWKDKGAFSQHWLSSAVEAELIKPQCWLKAPLSFHIDLYVMMMSIDVSQVGVAFSCLQHIFYPFIFPGFPFVLTFKNYSTQQMIKKVRNKGRERHLPNSLVDKAGEEKAW